MANILNLDPQVQIRIIDLAEQWSLGLMPQEPVKEEAWFKIKTEAFDKSFKAILKTYLPEQSGAPRTKKSLSF